MMRKSMRMMRISMLCLMVILPLVVSAYVLLEKLPDSGRVKTEVTGLTDYLTWLFRFMLVIAAFAAVVQIAVAGIETMIGGASEAARSDAKKRFWDAIWGLLLALGAWLILFTINPDLAKMKLGIPEIVINVETGGGGAGGGGGGFESGIEDQMEDASPVLVNLIDCMRSKMPSNVGRISSISDSNNRAGTPGFDRCKTCPRGTQISGCAHVCKSCHYGGTGTDKKSYAVDFGDEGNKNIIESAALQCGGAYIFEGDHIHVSAGTCNE